VKRENQDNGIKRGKPEIGGKKREV